MSKISLHDPFGYYKHKLWPKEGLGIKLAIWLPTTKSQELSRFPFVQVVCNISLKRQGLQLYFRPHLNLRYSHKVMGHQNCGSPNFGNFEISTWESWDKWHLGVSPVARHRVYYKGEGDGFPQVKVMVNIMNPCLPVVHPCTKVLQLHTNQLLVWCLQVCVSNWIVYQSS